ncbi:hypothetical protein [Alkaliphilus sp. B6464]|uniref:hypothetical protein n=1 Tax=Alkaliphilus sp. B6464 TaxID=2731219 RepID=UPI001BA87CFB|nr:hypothetical protein [Alkaliphilus sp. B6464]QUH21019.1 hypothetical protein HYG84_14805 [Alkaliphilus sp. B6464]
MKRKFPILIIMVSLIFGMTGCIIRNQSSAHNTITEGQKITDTYIYTVEDDFNGMKLEINLALTKGEVEFELKDPNGVIKWDGKATSEKSINEIREFEKIVGEWTLIFKSIDNTGEGKLELQFNRL